jgi:DNA transformation protein and related proteins
MPMRPEFRDYLLELFERFGPIRIKAMFGGFGLYSGDIFFGLVADERVYLKVDDTTRGDFEAEGKTHFTFKLKSGDIGAMSYYEIPDRLYDDPDDLALWTRKAVDVALRAASSKSRRMSAKPKSSQAASVKRPRRQSNRKASPR